MLMDAKDLDRPEVGDEDLKRIKQTILLGKTAFNFPYPSDNQILGDVRHARDFVRYHHDLGWLF
jgi:hypothetical protein